MLQSHDWRFWIGWYDHILRPGPSQSAEIEFEIQLTDTKVAVWRRSVIRVADYLNYLAEITLSSADTGTQPFPDLLIPPDVPPTKPAAIEPMILPDGRQGLSTKTARFDLNEGGVRAAFAAVKSGFAELALDAEDNGNIVHRSISLFTFAVCSNLLTPLSDLGPRARSAIQQKMKSF